LGQQLCLGRQNLSAHGLAQDICGTDDAGALAILYPQQEFSGRQHSSSAGVLVAGTWLRNTPRVLLIQQMAQPLFQAWLYMRPALI